ncbi:MAG: TIGR00366 family protein, partial [Candidatus Eremiobacteraeota bacterium]|nr:TIGR00366 family protein [Candidatus Eremiobacteraeota bacterium]
EYAMPDPYIYAVLLTLLTAVLAAIFAPHHSAQEIVQSWYSGIFDILSFAFQMILILVTGYALANATPVRSLLNLIASRPRSTKGAVTLTILVSSLACWINWGFGLVVAALIARGIAKRMNIDFGWLVAGAYTGFVVWASGLSSSIALAQATPGSALNIVEKFTGHTLPLGQTIFRSFNLVPVITMLIVMPLVFRALEPAASEVVTGDVERLVAEDEVSSEVRVDETLASLLENAWVLNVVLALAGLYYFTGSLARGHFSIDINAVIFIFLIAGLLLHWRPIAYVKAVNSAARVTGPLILQYPLYGGIMGMMTATGLAGVIASWFLTFSTAATLPFWSYVSSIIISLFVPSGGGHWAVQGPFAVPAALKLHASLPATAMGVAMGEQVANMIQPFWALPILAIAGIGLRRVMAFSVFSFCVGAVVFGASLLFLIPRS